MKNRLADTLSGVIIVFMFVVALWTISELPDDIRIVVHWGPDGEPNGWAGKWAGLLFVPVMALVARFSITVIPPGYSAPGKLPLPENSRRALLVCVLAIMAISEIAIAINALGLKFDPSNYLSVAISLIFVLIGLTFQKLQLNFFGFSKVLFNDDAWKNTQQFGRWVFLLCGLGIMSSTFGLSQDKKALVVTVFTIGTPLIVLLYAYLSYLRSGRK